MVYGALGRIVLVVRSRCTQDGFGFIGSGGGVYRAIRRILVVAKRCKTPPQKA